MDIEISEEFDFFVIGGGSGGLAASKEAAQFGVKVGLADFVDPTPIGTKWGIGGTCVNVGCIPKKLMHYTATYGENFEKSRLSGWNINETEKKHDWEKLVEKVQNNVKKTNFGYKVALRDAKVKYFNNYASLVDKNIVKLENKKGAATFIKAKHILISVGGRPKYLPHIDSKLIITSDDLFSLSNSPGYKLESYLLNL